MKCIARNRKKRGVPHGRVLLWLVDKIRHKHVDKLISSKFSNPIEDPFLHQIVKNHMVHGPGGILNTIPLDAGRSLFEKVFQSASKETITGEEGYPLYHRRSSQQWGFTAEIRSRGQQLILDKRRIMP